MACVLFVLLWLCVFSLHVLMRFVCDLLRDAVCSVCHCVWFFSLNCFRVLFVVYCDVARSAICLRVWLCVWCLCVFGVCCVCGVLCDVALCVCLCVCVFARWFIL